MIDALHIWDPISLRQELILNSFSPDESRNGYNS